ncbi:MAG: hypothetical protein IID40_10005 [Planctomycetes bacterium]|nr:hypothetical protein [Planctomycetota bacterium]
MSAMVSQSVSAASSPGGRLIVAPAHAAASAALAAAGWEHLDDLFAVDGAEWLDKASLPPWRQRLRIELPGLGIVYLKRYSAPPWGEQLRRMLSADWRRSTAAVEWARMQALAEAGIAAVEPVALGQEMIGPWERRSAVVTAAVPGESLERRAGRAKNRASREMVNSLARFVARFHGAGFVHRDLYLSHVFVEDRGGKPQFWLIDLARVFAPRHRQRRWMVKDLAALDYSTPRSAATSTDRMRFIKTYLGFNHLSPTHKRFIRQVIRKSMRIARHDAARNQP